MTSSTIDPKAAIFPRFLDRTSVNIADILSMQKLREVVEDEDNSSYQM